MNRHQKRYQIGMAPTRSSNSDLDINSMFDHFRGISLPNDPRRSSERHQMPYSFEKSSRDQIHRGTRMNYPRGPRPNKNFDGNKGRYSNVLPPQHVQPDLVLKLDKTRLNQQAHEFRTIQHGICSMFLINVKPEKKAYRYDVDICDMRGISITKGSDDGQRSLCRNLCYEVMTAGFNKSTRLGMEIGAEVVYDCKTTLYTSAPVNLPQKKIQIDKSDLGPFVLTYLRGDHFIVSITPNQACPVLNIGNFQQANRGSVFEEDRSWRTFLEMAISQYSINKNIYTPIGNAKLFEVVEQDEYEANEESIGNGMILRSGVAKGVRVVGNYGVPSPALVIDAKVSAFYKPQLLITTILEILNGREPCLADWGKIRSILVNVRVMVNYAPHRTFAIGRFSDKPLNQLFTELDRKKVTFTTYFEKKYNINIEYPKFPAVSPNTPVPRGRAVELFPIEQLTIMSDQRVPREKMDRKIVDKLLKANDVHPKDRFDKVKKHMSRMALFGEENPVLNAFGITIVPDSNKIVIGVRASPRIQFGNSEIAIPSPDKAEWRHAASHMQYIQSSHIRKWLVLFDSEGELSVKKFVNLFMDKAKDKGLIFEFQPDYKAIDGSQDLSTWSKIFKSCDQMNVEYVLLIDQKHDDTHGLLKYMEALYHVVTQHVTFEKALEVANKGKMETLGNILSKTNCKNFGINYVPLFECVAQKFSLDTNQVFVMGYDVCHPPPLSAQERRFLRAKKINAESMEPSVAGFAANMAENPNVFCGDYFYQESRKEAVDTIQLQETVTWMLKTMEMNRCAGNGISQRIRPEYFFILRDGLSEGQFLVAFDEEFKAIKSGVEDFDPNYNPKFVFVIGTKRHYKKFYLINEEGVVSNLLPGSVIDAGFTRPDLPEFFMQSHYPLRGTGKPVEYSVIVDEIGISRDELQAILNTLCYSHQIVSAPISLPEPVWQADELAKRGWDNYSTMKKYEPGRIPRLHNGMIDIYKLNLFLSYRHASDKARAGKNLYSTRFTA